MNSDADRRIVDTNVPVTANRARDPESIATDELLCVLACVKAIEHTVTNGGLVIDDGEEIFDEYRGNLLLSGQPGIGDKFLKWVHDHRWTFPDDDRVSITRNGDTYEEFPDHPDLQSFDVSDRKFVAVANAHPSKPVILQATDSKWWGWKDALADAGITITFLCEDLIAKKYQEKMLK